MLINKTDKNVCREFLNEILFYVKDENLINYVKHDNEILDDKFWGTYLIEIFGRQGFSKLNDKTRTSKLIIDSLIAIASDDKSYYLKYDNGNLVIEEENCYIDVDLARKTAYEFIVLNDLINVIPFMKEEDYVKKNITPEDREYLFNLIAKSKDRNEDCFIYYIITLLLDEKFQEGLNELQILSKKLIKQCRKLEYMEGENNTSLLIAILENIDDKDNIIENFKKYCINKN